MDSLKFTWIQTRDGSPTLWSNSLGESFRSVKGAFTESWAAFVEPSINYLKSKNSLGSSHLSVGEFGLGPGTNWLLWNLSLRLLHLPSTHYFVIEAQPQSFEMGLEHWKTQNEKLSAFFIERGIHSTPSLIQSLILEIPRPQIFPTLLEAAKASAQADIWFHDPFGFDVNPDGYSVETMSQIAQLLKPTFFACSYACNKNFKQALSCIPNSHAEKKSFAPYDIKRERLEFYRS